MKMTTPIRDFVLDYVKRSPLRLHMPGHKGASVLGSEVYDITEVAGADSLYEAEGIIRESEKNASLLFGCPTYYSTEGSSQCIRAMLHLAGLWHGKRRPESRMRVLAGRNAHKTFLSAAALLDFDITWLSPAAHASYLSCPLTAEDVEKALAADQQISAVYLTSPDYLGNLLPIREIARVCHRRGVLLLVDNAHGAYLRFLPPSLHPMDLGADLCCDSAHKTLPVLTGGAYLHVSDAIPELCAQTAKHALALFGSTSPSYLILQSLDMANQYLADAYTERLTAFAKAAEALKGRLTVHGFSLAGDEPLKLTLLTKPYGYRGTELAARMEEAGIVCEFSDPDHMVCMLTPEVGSDGLRCLEDALTSLPRTPAIREAPPVPTLCKAVMTARNAMLSPADTIPVTEAEGRILASPSVGCPPAIPIAVCGERLSADTIAAFLYYGITACTVLQEDEAAKK